MAGRTENSAHGKDATTIAQARAEGALTRGREGADNERRRAPLTGAGKVRRTTSTTATLRARVRDSQNTGARIGKRNPEAERPAQRNASLGDGATRTQARTHTRTNHHTHASEGTQRRDREPPPTTQQQQQRRSRRASARGSERRGEERGASNATQKRQKCSRAPLLRCFALAVFRCFGVSVFRCFGVFPRFRVAVLGARWRLVQAQARSWSALGLDLGLVAVAVVVIVRGGGGVVALGAGAVALCELSSLRTHLAARWSLLPLARLRHLARCRHAAAAAAASRVLQHQRLPPLLPPPPPPLPHPHHRTAMPLPLPPLLRLSRPRHSRAPSVSMTSSRRQRSTRARIASASRMLRCLAIAMAAHHGVMMATMMAR